MTIVSQSELVAGAIAGKVVSFPTDTVPALAVLPQNSELIFALKKRPQHKPLILMGASAEAILPYLKGTATEKSIWQQVFSQYWPGQLTLILPASELVPTAMNPTDPATIGVRVPSHQLALEILASTGPLATTSANISGEATAENLASVAATFLEVLTLDCSLDWQQGSGLPSTLAKWTGSEWKILRQGKIKKINH